MAKNVIRIVLTGGPAAGKTTLISRILKEFKQEDGWKVITIPETATDLISGFGIRPFGNCMSMYEFQYFVFEDQFHKEKMALKAAEIVPEENVMIVYDRAIFDNRAYISDAEFSTVLSHFGKTEDEVLSGYDAVIHLVTCAKGAEYAYNFGNAARTESIEDAREKDDLALRSWSRHPNVNIIDNSDNFDEKMNRAIACIYRLLGRPTPKAKKKKYLIEKPDTTALTQKFGAAGIEMMQTYLASVSPSCLRRVRQQADGNDYLYFYTEQRSSEDGSCWETERPISQKEYISFLMECDSSMHPVRKTKYRFTSDSTRMEIDVYPFSGEKAVLFIYGDNEDTSIPDGITVIRDITDLPEYKNRSLAKTMRLE